MFAINHAVTALAVKRVSPGTPLPWLLVSVQLVELLWVLLVFTGQELVATEPTVRSLADIHLIHMPWSHSLLTTLVAAVALGSVVARLTKSPRSGLAVGLGVASHVVLDLVMHAPDIALAPLVDAGKLGLGLYQGGLMGAFAVELAWGLTCVALYRGGRGLYAAVLLFNVANISMFSPGLVGPEAAVAGRPLLLAGFVGAQIVLTLSVVCFLGSRRDRMASRPALEPA